MFRERIRQTRFANGRHNFVTQTLHDGWGGLGVSGGEEKVKKV
jgi:hypothetical protein